MSAAALLLALAFCARAAQVKAVDAYAAVVKYGAPASAAALGAPDLPAKTLSAEGCAITVFDRAQQFALDAHGRLTGAQLACQVLSRKDGRQLSFKDPGCGGEESRVLKEGGLTSSLTPEPGEFQAAVSDCYQRVLAERLGNSWAQYLAKKDKVSLEMLDGLGQAFDRAFGREALVKRASELPAAAPGSKSGKTSALEVFRKAAWWRRPAPR